MKNIINLLLFVVMTTTTSLYAEEIVDTFTKDDFFGFDNKNERYFFSLGPAGFSNMKESAKGSYFSGGTLWHVSDYSRLKISVEGAFDFQDEKTSFVAAQLGNQYHFTPYDTAPFLGADLGYAAAMSSNDSVDNRYFFAVGIEGGVTFFRKSDAQLQLKLRQTFMLEENNLGLPSVFSFTLGILF